MNKYNFKDTLGEKIPSIKSLAPTESVNMNIWIVGTPNQSSHI